MESLRTDRLLLRHWDESDLAAFFDLYSREEVARWLGAHPRRPLATAAEARERLGRWRDHERGLSAPFGLWAMVPRAADGSPGQPVGTLLLLPLSDGDGPTGLVEVGWHLHPEHQGRGLATEAARAVLARAAAAGIDQVLAITDLDNAASQRVAVRLGMADEGMTERWFGLTARQLVRFPGGRARFPGCGLAGAGAAPARGAREGAPGRLSPGLTLEIRHLGHNLATMGDRPRLKVFRRPVSVMSCLVCTVCEQWWPGLARYMGSPAVSPPSLTLRD